MARFPLKAAVRSNADDVPKPAVPTTEVCIFDNYGYHASFGTGAIALPADQLDLGNQIAEMLNRAYAQGQAEAQEAMRHAMGITG